MHALPILTDPYSVCVTNTSFQSPQFPLPQAVEIPLKHHLQYGMKSSMKFLVDLYFRFVSEAFWNTSSFVCLLLAHFIIFTPSTSCISNSVLTARHCVYHDIIFVWLPAINCHFFVLADYLWSLGICCLLAHWWGICCQNICASLFILQHQLKTFLGVLMYTYTACWGCWEALCSI